MSRFLLLPVVCLLALPMLGCPLGPFSGGRLSGDVGKPASDWAFVNAVDTCQLETNPADPHSINVWCVGVGGHPYVPSSMILGTTTPSERAWVKNVLADPAVRLRVEGTVYELRAVRVEDGEEFEKVRSMLEQKYDLDPGERDPERVTWIFRLEAR